MHSDYGTVFGWVVGECERMHGDYVLSGGWWENVRMRECAVVIYGTVGWVVGECN